MPLGRQLLAFGRQTRRIHLARPLCQTQRDGRTPGATTLSETERGGGSSRDAATYQRSGDGDELGRQARSGMDEFIDVTPSAWRDVRLQDRSTDSRHSLDPDPATSYQSRGERSKLRDIQPQRYRDLSNQRRQNERLGTGISMDLFADSAVGGRSEPDAMRQRAGGGGRGRQPGGDRTRDGAQRTGDAPRYLGRRGTGFREADGAQQARARGPGQGQGQDRRAGGVGRGRDGPAGGRAQQQRGQGSQSGRRGERGDRAPLRDGKEQRAVVRVVDAEKRKAAMEAAQANVFDTSFEGMFGRASLLLPARSGPQLRQLAMQASGDGKANQDVRKARLLHDAGSFQHRLPSVPHPNQLEGIVSAGQRAKSIALWTIAGNPTVPLRKLQPGLKVLDQFLQ